MKPKIYYMGKLQRDSEGRFTSFKRKAMWFLKSVGKGMVIGLVALSLYVGGQMSKDDIIPVAEAQDKFADYPLLVKICKAESQNNQFKKDGSVLRGKVTPSDIGYCQINEPIWNDEARKLGLDIYTEEGNKQMAIHIFLTQGDGPWNSSRCSANRKTNCWSK